MGERSGGPVASSRLSRGDSIETDTLVVGAGPQALTVVARWACDRPSSVERLVVVDPSGRWMHAWDDQFRRQRIDVLRSPGVHHPDPDLMAFIHRHPDRCVTDSLAGRRPSSHDGPLRRPATMAFAEFSRDLIERTGLSRRIVAGTVVELHAAGESTCGRRWSARLDEGTTVTSRRVIWAGNPRRRRVPDGVELGGSVRHSGDVDVGDAAVGECIVVLGQGQSAGQLALVAARAGARVVLVGRGAPRVSHLDVDAGWLMDDKLDPFRSIADPDERRQIIVDTCRGSMTADLVEELERSTVQWLDGAEDLTARPDGDGAVVEFAGATLSVDRVWCATGSVPDLRVDPTLDRLAVDGAPHVDGWPVLDDRLQWLDGLHVIGALAALTLGPAAGNLGGARAAADRLADVGP